MSTDTKPAQPAPEEAASTPKKKSKVGALLGFVIPALLAAGAAYGGTPAARARTPTVIVQQAPAPSGEHGGEASHPPGPTLPLEPFLVTIFDANHKPHPMKMSVAVEFDAAPAHGDLKDFVPRIRDAV